jgi:hypothetical protein
VGELGDAAAASVAAREGMFFASTAAPGSPAAALFEAVASQQRFLARFFRLVPAAAAALEIAPEPAGVWLVRNGAGIPAAPADLASAEGLAAWVASNQFDVLVDLTFAAGEEWLRTRPARLGVALLVNPDFAVATFPAVESFRLFAGKNEGRWDVQFVTMDVVAVRLLLVLFF